MPPWSLKKLYSITKLYRICIVPKTVCAMQRMRVSLKLFQVKPPMPTIRLRISPAASASPLSGVGVSFSSCVVGIIAFEQFVNKIDLSKIYVMDT